MRSLAPMLVVLVLAAPASAQERPRDQMVPITLPTPPSALVNSHVLYLNNCRPNGCTVTSGTTDARTDHSDIAHGHLSALASNVSWDSVKSCITTIMAPFNITVTDVDPGMAEHFEIMIGGNPQDLGLSAGIGGVSPVSCSQIGACTYIPNALVFDFAAVWQGDITAICGTAAQEIAHAWTLDHSTLANDPMTYKNYSPPLMYRDGSPCGSDCGYQCPGGTGNCNAFGLTCTGTGFNATHACMENNAATQNEVQIITALFGPAGAKAPMVAITSPSDGSAEQTGQPFNVTATCTTGDGIQAMQFAIDGVQKATLTTSPSMFSAPGTLTEGAHKLTVTCATNLQATATATSNIVVGTLCAQDSDCPANGICYQKACIAGPNAPGGLGSPCTDNSTCKSGSCANDGSQMLCVVPCDTTNDQCPGGFGCLDTGAGNNAGVCWLGADKSSGGCCDTRGDSRGSILFGLGFAALFVTWKRPRKRA